MQGSQKKRRAVFSAAIAIALAVAALRVWFAWLYSVDVNPDGAIVHLMVRHVLEGGPLPVFFYGQAYMGSFEPMVSALVAKVFGFSLFAVCCGTALLGACMVAWAAFWAWRAAGRLAGAVALALLAVGLQSYIHYLASPRGGYGALMLFTVSTLALGSILLEAELRGRRHLLAYLALGLGAGVGFWSHFLTLPSVAAVGLAFLAFLRGKAFKARIIVPAACGFFLGSAPMWVWNALHGWDSLAMGDSVGFTVKGAAQSLFLFAGPRFSELLGAGLGAPGALLALAAAAHVAALAPAFFCLFSSSGQDAAQAEAEGGSGALAPSKALRVHVFAAFAWLAFFVACFAASPQYTAFRTPRYLLPMVPVAAWLCGVGAARAPRRFLRAAALCAAALCVAWQLYLLPNSFAFHRKHSADVEHFRELGDALRERGISSAYSSYLLYLLNPLEGPSFFCTDPKKERYAPFARGIELDPSPAVLDNLGGIGAWALASGGSVECSSVPGHRIYHGLRPPEAQLEEVPLADASFTDASGAPLDDASGFHDLRRMTMLRDRLPYAEPETVVVSFPEPVTVSAVRLWGVATPPVGWDVSARDTPGGEFTVLAKQAGLTDFFWSGPRVFWAGPQLRHECRFPATSAREFRLRFFKNRDRPRMAIPEIQFLRDAEGCEETSAPDPSGLIEALRNRGITRLYADRWIANQVYEGSGGGIWTSRARSGMIGAEVFQDSSGDVSLAPGTAVLAPLAALPSLRAALAERLVEYGEEPLPPYGTLFTLEPEDDASGAPLSSGIRFAGAYALLVHSPRWVASRLAALGPEPSVEDLRDLYGEADSMPPLMRAYTNALEHAGAEAEAAAVAARIDALEAMRSGGPATFFGDVTWLGAEVSPAQVPRGGHATLGMAWCGNLRRLSRYLVFVHLVGRDGTRFQCDHPLDACTADDDDPYEQDMPLMDVVDIRVPEDIPPGTYDLQFGIYPATGGARVAPSTGRPTKRRAVVIKDFLSVE